MDEDTGAVEKLEKEDLTDPGLVKIWLERKKMAEKEAEDWRKQCKEIKKVYKDDSQTGNRFYGSSSKINIFWSNVQTMQPALYARTPKPEVRRRFMDKDAVGKAAAEILERATEFAIDAYDFDSVMRRVRDDYLICGMGVARVFYEPITETQKERRELTPKEGKLYDGEEEYAGEQESIINDGEAFYYESEYEAVAYEEVKCGYVHVDDFNFSPARTWDEVTWVSFDSYMTRDELIERFGEEIGSEINLDFTPSQYDEDKADKPKGDYFKKAKITEIWDKETRKVYWICGGYPDGPLDTQDDPLGLTDFFPCPKPLFATQTNDTLIPVPDYKLYQDQAAELDEITGRINALVKALRLAGVYDASCEGLQRLIEESAENQLIPIENWPSFAQSGGFQGVVQFMPIQEAAQVLQVLYEARDRTKSDLYEVTGMSDIIRGASNPNETATAQQIKGQFATLRLSDRQADVQRFARDLIALKAEVIAEHFEEQTLMLMAGTEMLAQTDLGMQVNFSQAVELLRDDVIRAFRIDIETDSTIAIDEQMEKQAASEYLASVGQFMNQALPIAQQYPALATYSLEAISQVSRRFNFGRSLEATLDMALDQMKAQVQQQLMQQQQAANQPPPPDPKMVKVQQEAQAAQAKMQMDMQIKQSEMQMKMQEKQAEMALKQQEMLGQLQLQADKIQKEMQLKAAELARKGDLDTAADLGVPFIPTQDKVTEVEFYDDPVTGTRKARAVTSRQAQ